MIDPVDYVEIQQLYALYGHIADQAEWSRMDELFTEDVQFDGTDFGGELYTSLERLHASWSTTDAHPLAHHATNVLITKAEADSVEIMSKGISVLRDGRVISIVYCDTVVRRAQGWRFARRDARRRRMVKNG